jgi:hypothetical protein
LDIPPDRATRTCSTVPYCVFPDCEGPSELASFLPWPSLPNSESPELIYSRFSEQGARSVNDKHHHLARPPCACMIPRSSGGSTVKIDSGDRRCLRLRPVGHDGALSPRYHDGRLVAAYRAPTSCCASSASQPAPVSLQLLPLRFPSFPRSGARSHHPSTTTTTPVRLARAPPSNADCHLGPTFRFHVLSTFDF